MKQDKNRRGVVVMITGNLKDLSVLSKLGGNFTAAVEYLKNLDVAALEPKRYDVDGNNVYAIFCELALHDPAELPFEVHGRYADIQLVIDGCEGMWQVPVSEELPVRTPYDATKDIGFYNDPACYNKVYLSSGEFAVFFPEDAHKPCCATEGCTQSRKLLVKVLLE